MTAFSLPTFDDPFKVPPIEAAPETTFRPPRKVRQVAADSAIMANRAQTPPAVAEQRSTKRLSIGEMNEADMPTLMERYQAQRYDDRGAVTRFLDLLDMPRNLLVSTVFPSIRRRKEAEGETGTFGMGTVRFSDVLDELGVENRVVKGVLGFVGDVALDPLTYLGPAGWGGKIVGTGGKAVELTAEGRRALNAAAKAAARGKPVADATASGVLRAFGFGDEALAASRAGKSAAQIEREIKAGIFGAQSKANRVGSAIGLDLQTSGSKLADAFHSAEETAQSVAAREFVKQYGRGAAKGYQFGTGAVGAGTGNAAGSYVAHLPFTSYGLFVPAFTGPAMQAASVLDRANAGFSAANKALGVSVGKIRGIKDRAQELTNAIKNGSVESDDAPLAANTLFHGTRTTDLSTFIDQNGNLVLRPSANFDGKQIGVSFAPTKETSWDYATRRPGTGPSRSRAQATVFEIDQSALDQTRLRQEAADEISAHGPDDVVIPKGKFRVHQDRDAIARLSEWENERVRETTSISDRDLVRKHSAKTASGEMAEFGGQAEFASTPAEGVSHDIVAKYGHVAPDSFPVWQEMVNRVHGAPDPQAKALELAALLPANDQFNSPERLAKELLEAKPGPHSVSRPFSTGAPRINLKQIQAEVESLRETLKASVLEDGLNPAAPQNRLSSVADVMKQHEEYQKAQASLDELLGASRDTLDTVAKRRAILKSLDIDAKVADRLEQSRKLHEAYRPPMPKEFDEQEILALADRDPEAASRFIDEYDAAVQKRLEYGEFDEAGTKRSIWDDEVQKVVDRVDPMSGRTMLDEAQIEMLKTDPADAAKMEALADSLQTEIQARGQYANAIGGTLAEAMKETDNAAVARVAAELMGSGVEIGGWSLFDSLRNVARRTFGDDKTATQTALGKIDALGESARRAFGGPDGQAKRLMRSLEAQQKNIAEVAYRSRFDPMVTEIKGVLAKHGIAEDRWREASDAATALSMLMRDPTGANTALDGAELFSVLERAKAAGLGVAFEDLKALAGKYQDIHDSMTEAEWLDLILGTQREAYLYGPATKEGAEFFRGLKPTVDAQGVKSASPAAAFNTMRVTDKAQWVGRDGTKKQLYQWMHNYYTDLFSTPTGALKENALDMMRAAGISPNVEFWTAFQKGRDVSGAVGSLEPAEKMIYDVLEYNSLPPEMKLGIAKFKQVDPWTKNKEIPELFGMMNPGQTIPKLFETSLADLHAQRTASHEYAHIRDQFNKILGQYAQPIVKSQNMGGTIQSVEAMPYGATVRFSNGATGTIVKQGGDYIVEVGGNQYRKLRNNLDVAQALRSFGADVYGPDKINLVFPVKVAEAFERLADAAKNPIPVLKAYDEFLRLWKGFTLAHPSWIVGDVIGGLFQAVMGGVSPMKLGRRFKDGIRLSMAADKPELLKSIAADLHGMSPEEFILEVGKMNGLSGHAHGVPVAEMLSNGVELPGYTGKVKEAFTQPGEFFPTRLREMRSRAAAKMESTARGMALQKIPLPNGVKQAAYYKNLVLDEGLFHHMIRPFFAANGKANDAMRIASILAYMDDGHDLAGATMKTVEAMFDVSDLTKFENTAMKRLIPFYSWMKHSGTYWTRRMLENPALLSVAPRVQRAIEESMYGDQTIPQHMRPNWMRDQMALQIGADPDSRYALTLGTLMPTETAASIGAAATSPLIGVQGLKQLTEQVGFGLNVPLKMLVELASGREMFSGREIGFNPDQGDLTAGEYLASQVRPLRELGIGNIRQGPIQKAAEAGAVPLASRLLLGGRSQPFDDERIRQNMLREFKQAEQSIRKRVTIAQREGNQVASVEARARLLRLYAEMAQKGLGDQVPAWARGQLPQVAGGS